VKRICLTSRNANTTMGLRAGRARAGRYTGIAVRQTDAGGRYRNRITLGCYCFISSSLAEFELAHSPSDAS
jgi:hypothetical protein